MYTTLMIHFISIIFLFFFHCVQSYIPIPLILHVIISSHVFHSHLRKGNFTPPVGRVPCPELRSLPGIPTDSQLSVLSVYRPLTLS